MSIEVLNFIGKGANGSVFRGVDHSLGRAVAIKFFDNSFDSVRTQVEQHCASLKNIVHQNVVAIFGTTEIARPGAPDSKTELALIMEYLPGMSFAAWLATRGKSLADLRRVGLGIIEGVMAFHKQGMAHGDLHVGNVHVCEGIAKILDPMEHDPFAVRTTALNQHQQGRDVRAARDLLLSAMLDFGLRSECTEIMASGMNADKSMDDVRARFLDAMKEADSPGSVIDVLRDTYRHGSAAMEGPGQTKWIAFSRSVRRESRGNFEELLRDQRWGRISPENIRQEIDRTVTAVGPEWIRSIVAIEHRTEDALDSVQALDFVLTSEDLHAASAARRRCREAAYHILFYIVGAVSIMNRRADCAIALARHVISDDSNHEREATWKRKPIAGWPSAISDSAVVSWRFVRNTFATLPVLRDIFATEHDYIVHTAAFNLALSMLDLGSASREQLVEAIRGGAVEMRPGVPPHWLHCNAHQFADVWKAVRSARLTSTAFQGSQLLEADAQELWPAWTSGCIRAWRTPGNPFEFDHLPTWVIKEFPS